MLADIIAEIESKKIETAIMYLPKYASGKPSWSVSLEYINDAGDKLKVNRVNTDFEAAFIAAYEAIRQGMTQGVQLALESKTDDIPF